MEEPYHPFLRLNMHYNLQLHLNRGGFSNGIWRSISQIMQELYICGFETTVEDKSDVEGIHFIGILV